VDEVEIVDDAQKRVEIGRGRDTHAPSGGVRLDDDGVRERRDGLGDDRLVDGVRRHQRRPRRRNSGGVERGEHARLVPGGEDGLPVVHPRDRQPCVDHDALHKSRGVDEAGVEAVELVVSVRRTLTLPTPETRSARSFACT